MSKAVRAIVLDEVVIAKKRRRGVCLKTVERYRKLMEMGVEMPPVTVTQTIQGTYAVRDGRHRVMAARAAGEILIEAVVR